MTCGQTDECGRVSVELSGGRLGYHLDYRIGGEATGPLQADVLSERARKAQIAEAYVLHSPVDLERFAWGCRELEPKPEHFGVSCLPAAVAQALVEDRTLDFGRVAEESRPSPCLVRCGLNFGCGFEPLGPLGPFAANSIRWGRRASSRQPMTG